MMEATSSYTFDWRNVRGWLTEQEAAELSRLAEGKVVLEIGTFCGRSALAMATTARKVYCLDNFMGYPGVHLPTRDEALGNFDRAGTNGKIVVLQGSQEDILPRMNLADIDLVFYDADHSMEGTTAAIQLLYDAGLPETATLAFHDYDKSNPGVVMAVNDFYRPRGRKPRTVDDLAIFDGREAEKQEHAPAIDRHNVMLGIPTNSQHMLYGAAQGLFRATWKHHVTIAPGFSGLLASGFNFLWAQALNRAEKGEITHLAFLHSDIAPCDGWIDSLIEEMETYKASFCSAISPIKDMRGLTSTGVGEPGFTWSPLRRFTMKEVMKFPETFDAESAGFPGKVLLLNSGCWVADLRDEAFHAKNDDDEARMFFTINDRVVKTDGKWVHQVESEDWFFSRLLHQYGIKSMATRKVSLLHMGMSAFSNDSAWGNWECDEDLRPLWEPNANT